MTLQTDLIAEAEKQDHEWARKNLDHAITFGVEALKAAMLLNGGAAIALMTLVGALSVKDSIKVNLSIDSIKNAIVYFGCGVGTISLCFGIAYITQIFFMGNASSRNSKYLSYAINLRYATIALFLLSIIFLFLGIINGLNGIGPNIKTLQNLEAVCRNWSGLSFSQCK